MTQPARTLAEALEREHRKIDAGVEAFIAGSDERAAESLRRAIAALRRHIYVEEERVFPQLREQGLFAPLLVMLREHGQLWNALDRIERSLGVAVDDMAYLCHQLLVQLQHHNVKEERIIYPTADQSLTPDAAAELVAFLHDGDLPDGWVCAKAAADGYSCG